MAKKAKKLKKPPVVQQVMQIKEDSIDLAIGDCIDVLPIILLPLMVAFIIALATGSNPVQ